MTSKEEEIRRCKAIIGYYRSLDKQNLQMGLETRAKIDQSLRLFPKCKEDDALYPIEELLDMYQDLHNRIRGCFSRRVDSQGRVQGPNLTLGLLLEYFERNGPGTSYLKALSLFASLSTVVPLNNDDTVKILLRSFDVVLNRVDHEASQHPADCAAMLNSLKDVSIIFNQPSPICKTPPNIREEYFEKATSLCKKYPAADSRVLIGLYSLTNTLAGSSFEDINGQSSKLREDLIKAFLKIKHPDHSRLEVLSAWLLQSLDLPLFAFRLFILGLQLVRQMPSRANTFLESVYAWLLSKRLHFILMMHMPEAMVLIEETASPESIPCVQCLLICLTGDMRDLRTQEYMLVTKRGLLDAGVQITEESDFTLVERWQQRLLLKAVELFSVPSPLTATEGAEKLKVSVQEIAADSKCAALNPLLELWRTQLVDNRYSWTHRLNLFSRKYQDPPGSLSNSNRIWMSDPSRYSVTSTTEFKIAASLFGSVRKKSRKDPLRKHNVDMILLMTWFRAAASLQRLKTKSKLSLLNMDILRRLARMIGPNTKEKIFRIQWKPKLTRV